MNNCDKYYKEKIKEDIDNTIEQIAEEFLDIARKYDAYIDEELEKVKIK